MQDILINWAPQETRVAIVENGAVQELHVERTLERGLVGNIYLGRVARVDRKSTRLNSSHNPASRMPSSA
jgi:Ribonuclease G/E